MRKITIILAIMMSYVSLSAQIQNGTIADLISVSQELKMLDGDTSDIVYRTEPDTLPYPSVPHWIAKIPVRIYQYHASILPLIFGQDTLPITAQSRFEQIGVSFTDVNTEADLQNLLRWLESHWGASTPSDKFPGVLTYKWSDEEGSISLSWTERTNAYIMIVPHKNEP